MKKAQLLLLETPLIITNEPIKNGDGWVYVNPQGWDTPQDFSITINNLGSEWFEKLWDKENYKNVISLNKLIDFNGNDFSSMELGSLCDIEIDESETHIKILKTP